MDEDRDSDKAYKLVPEKVKGRSIKPVSVDVIKSSYIAEGLSSKEIADKYQLKFERVEKLVKDENLPALRAAYIRQGLEKIQNIQIAQAEKLMDLESNFKKLRVAQLEKMLEDYAAYYARHGDFYKRHPVSGEILTDTNGIPMQISIPNITREINNIKDAITLSEGTKKILDKIDDIINPPENDSEDNDDVIDMDDIDDLF